METMTFRTFCINTELWEKCNEMNKYFYQAHCVLYEREMTTEYMVSVINRLLCDKDDSVTFIWSFEIHQTKLQSYPVMDLFKLYCCLHIKHG